MPMLSRKQVEYADIRPRTSPMLPCQHAVLLLLVYGTM